MSAICVRVDAKTGDSGRCGALVRYTLNPSETNPAERLIFSGSGNLLASSSDGIIAEMRRTVDAARAIDSRISIDPFEHFVISFEDHDAVSNGDFKAAAKIALKHLGLEDHQFIFGGHNDTGNLHMHLTVSRINPGTLKAVTLPFVVKQAEQIGALINHELGMKPLIKNRYSVNEKGVLEKTVSSRVKQPDKLREIIGGARSWADFHLKTRAIGINYERKGIGALINGVKASDIDRSASFSKLVNRWGEFVPALGVTEIKAVVPAHVLRAKERAEFRALLSARHRAERTKVFETFKERKNELWDVSNGRGFVKVALASLIAGEQAKAMAELRAAQAVQRVRLRAELSTKRPLLEKEPAEECSIKGESLIVQPVPVGDIRDYHASVIDDRTVAYSLDGTDRASFIDNGRDVTLFDKSDESILAAMQLAVAKFGKLVIYGDDKFKADAIRIAVANNITIKNPGLQVLISAEKERFDKEKVAVMDAKYPAKNDFKALASAVGDARWRVTLGSYVEVVGKDGKPWTPTSVLRDDKAPALTSTGSGKGHDGLSVDQVCDKWGIIDWAQNDEKKARVILTPASDSLHIIHIDDVSDAALERLSAEGFAPCAIIQTSPNKHNVLLTAPKDKTLSETQNHDLAKRVSQALNKQYGDPAARNAVQPFRAPGFKNMKPKYEDECGDYPAIVLKHAVRGDCSRLVKAFNRLNQEALEKIKATPLAAPAKGKVFVATAKGAETEAYFAHVKSIRAAADAGKLQVRLRKDGTFDQSSIDVLAAQRMRMTGWSSEQIAQGVANGCNEVRSFHCDKEKRGVPEYAARTAETAAKVDLTPFEHQLKYRLYDEKQAGVVSPIVVERERIETEEQEAAEAEALANVMAYR